MQHQAALQMMQADMLETVAHSRFDDAMVDCQQIQEVMSLPDDEIEDFSWGYDTTEGRMDMMEAEDPKEDWHSNFWIAPFTDIFNFERMPQIMPEQQVEEDLNTVYATDPFYEQPTTEFHTIVFYTDGMAAPNRDVYDTDTALQQFAYEEWMQEQQAQPTEGQLTAGDMIWLGALVASCMYIVYTFVYNWVALKNAMVGNSNEPTADPDMVRVMFNHNGRLVRGYMALDDFVESQQADEKMKVQEKGKSSSMKDNSKDAMPRAGVVVAADLV
eukprot:gene2474-5426_t